MIDCSCRLHLTSAALARGDDCGGGHVIEMGCLNFVAAASRSELQTPLAVMFVSIMISYAALIIA